MMMQIQTQRPSNFIESNYYWQEIMDKIHSEPDSKTWKVRIKGITYKCKIVRHPETLTLCGYVGVPRQHPLFTEDCTNLDSIENSLSVYGGISFYNYNPTNYLAGPSFHDMTVFGFDCGHSFDFEPGMFMHPEKYQDDRVLVDLFVSSTRFSYKDFEFVKKQVKHLLKQLVFFSDPKKQYIINESAKFNTVRNAMGCSYER